jgi:inosine/xanthosine triphosphatase
MLVAVGSRNPAKVNGVMRVFKEYFPGAQVLETDASAVTKIQPKGVRQIIEGATKRAKFARKHFEADFGVGVEAGIFRVDSRFCFLNQQYAVITNSRNKVSVGTSTAFPLPSRLVKTMIREGKELEHYAERVTGVDRVAEKEGLVYHLTKGRMSRTDLTVQCVTAALVPWLNAKLYGF